MILRTLPLITVFILSSATLTHADAMVVDAENQGETSDPCRVELGAQNDDGAEDDGESVRATNSLAATLEECEGVLTPPRIGDRPLVEPAPDIGKTPVIPPRALSNEPVNPEE